MQEDSVPILSANSLVSPNTTSRSRSNGKSLPNRGLSDRRVDSMLLSPVENSCKERNDQPPPIATCSSEGPESNTVHANIVQQQQHHFDLRQLRDEFNRESIQPAFVVDENPVSETPQASSSAAVSGDGSSTVAVLNPDEILISCLTACLVPLYRGSQKIQILHKGSPFQLCCTDLKIRFGVNAKFKDHAGVPKLNFVADLDPSQSLCKVLEACDGIAQKLSLESGSSSDWRPVVVRKDGFFNYPTMRLQ